MIWQRNYQNFKWRSKRLRPLRKKRIRKLTNGSYRTADFLNKNGYRPNNGGKFTSIKVNCILRNPFYCGRLEDGTTSPQLEALRLRNDDTYDRILYILRQRQSKNEEKRHIALQTRGQAIRTVKARVGEAEGIRSKWNST